MSDSAWISANIFDITVRRPIVYFYDAAGKNDVALYRTPSHGALLGMPQAKLVATLGNDIGAGFDLSGSLTLLGPRWAWVNGDGSGTGVQDELGPVPMLDVFLARRDVVHTGRLRVDAGLGLFNALGSRNVAV